MASLQDKFDSEKLAIVTISLTNNKRTSESYFNNALKGQKVSFPALLGNIAIQKSFKGNGTPNTFILDRQGQVRYKHRGFSKHLGKYIEMEIQSLL